MTGNASISLNTVHSILGWPAPTDVTHPQGAGASVFASLVRDKIGGALSRFPDAKNASIGVLMADSHSVTSEPPMAIVVEFQSIASESTLRELHRLAWNFSHVPTLITIEPSLLRVWSCCEPPDPNRKIDEYLVHHLGAERFSAEQAVALEYKATRALHWINLVSGEFFSEHSDRFDRDGRADQMLLGNLRHIRTTLADLGLTNDDVCHDLLARIIFVQFLFDRKDKDGQAALTPAKLSRLHNKGILKNNHTSFESILLDYEDTYRLFDWLNERFNGDLFPGKGDTKKDRSHGWAKEKNIVKTKHLSLLAAFICGDLDMPSGQGCLWPQYAFDVIPLEFISSIYETFVTERAAREGIFYTPPYLVDFVLDRVLPWNGKEWDLKVLDPACGSGIFLVKSFQRLVHRWKKEHPNEPIRAEILRHLLEHNIFGVDKDPHAVRVACFSLYLAMCDEIEPRHYWTQVTFPTMRGRRLICADFFTEGCTGFDTESDSKTYDLVVGNAPWGGGLVTEYATKWATSEDHKWTIPNKDIGGLFLAKSAHLVNQNGKIALIQSANSLLFNISSPASKFRKKLFSTYRVEEIYNLSTLRFKVFKRKSHTTKTSVSPACIFIMSTEASNPEDQINFISPKQLKPLVDEFTIIIEQKDWRRLTVQEAISDNSVWPTLMWGGLRDRQLLRKLRTFSSLDKIGKEYQVSYQQGITYGDGKKPAPHLDGRRIFSSQAFPEEDFLFLETDDLPIADGINLHSKASTGLEAFVWPQLIIKHSWHKQSGRFHARLAQSKTKRGVLCNQSYLSVHADQAVLEAACLSHNSVMAVYYHFLTSGRFAAYRPKLSKDEILELPIPLPELNLINGLESYGDLDALVFDLFELNAAERVLIEDLIDYTLADFTGNGRSLGHTSTASGENNENETHLTAYCEHFVQVLKAGFGEDRAVNATIFRTGAETLPYRLVAFELSNETESSINVTEIKSVALLNEFERLSKNFQNLHGGIFKEQVTRIYDASDGRPTIFIIKPDKKRYWTRSEALQDGDEVALDMFQWQQSRSLEAVQH